MIWALGGSCGVARRGGGLRPFAAALLACGLSTAAARAADAPRQAALPDLARTKHRTFAIPFRVPKSTDPDAEATAERVVLNVSTDMGLTWLPAGEAAASANSITFRAETDGEYWFRLRAIDRKGRSRGGEGPDLRVLVDAAGPRVAGRVWKGADGEIICRYAAADDSLSLESLRVEYRVSGESGWKTVAAQAILARESPAHLVGEEIWWAGEKVAALTVRVSITDAAGNPATRQFSLEASDPRVDQAALAADIGVPPLPAAGIAGDPDPAALDSSPRTAAAGAPPDAGGRAAGWSPESAGGWLDGQPQAAARPADTGPSVLVRPATASVSAQAAAGTDAVRRLGDADDLGREPGGGLRYRGLPLQLTSSRRLAWEYHLPAPGPATGPRRPELWTTLDGGVTWQRTAVDPDGRSPIEVTLPAAGLYGVRLETATPGGTGPRSGATPDAWLGVDEEPPQVELEAIERDDSRPPGELVIRYAVRDPLIAPRAVRLLYSPNRDGPWATIAADLENHGEHRWSPDRSVPAAVYVRAEATDLAGNVGGATAADEVAVAAPRAGGTLGGLRPLPAAP